MKFELKLGEKKLKVEINDLAEQANASALVSLGDTLVLATCVMSQEDKEGLGFFPLTVEYQERYYAAGKIKGPRYIKREGRPSDEAICNSRLIDRAIRPRFPKEMAKEVQVITTVLSWDAENDPDILGLLAASTALFISDIPWLGPLGAVRICQKDGKFVLNPTYEERGANGTDIIFSSVEKDNELLINMLEGNLEESSEKTVCQAFDFAEKYLKEIINFQKKIRQKVGKEKLVLAIPAPDESLEREIRKFLGDKLEKAFYQKNKNQRGNELEQLKKELISFTGEDRKQYVENLFIREIDRLFHQSIIKYKKRPDNRKLDEIRKLDCQAGLLPRTHGSGLFCRGQTKALSILTLGAPGDQQLLEGMEIVCKKRFMHHYNFPPYSSGEVKPLRGPGRREIGHGMLVEKALLPLIPNFDEFPYTMRVVTEILSSNGSTSMASVSSSSLALMDAGVPIKRPAAGIAMGLAGAQVLTDIQGPEDHYGDMDFKVAGTRQGITALQMDVKVEGISKEIMK
ncbi:MAG: polyribonucleotide nucleotidyltransferase, partial [Candidatus Nealsonbacteria bacterium CG08_land_8_20_14_0_20_36_22]